MEILLNDMGWDGSGHYFPFLNMDYKGVTRAGADHANSLPDNPSEMQSTGVPG
jgi:hypothetical protein